MKYTEAIEELEMILKDLEQSEEVNMDKISAQVKRAGELMTFCRGQLQQLDESLAKMIEEID